MGSLRADGEPGLTPSTGSFAVRTTPMAGLWVMGIPQALIFLFFAPSEPMLRFILGVTQLALTGAVVWALGRQDGEASIHDDGILVRRELRTRFLSFAKIATFALDAERRRVLVLLEDEKIAFMVQEPGAFIAEANAKRAAYLEKAAENVPASLLVRSESGGVESGEGYRDAALPVTELWRVVENPAAPVEARVAAVASLRGQDPLVRPRVRAASRACGNARLRRALEEALGDEGDAFWAAGMRP